MTDTINSVPVPMALKELINTSNTLLQNYQQELTSRVQIANREIMTLMGLSSEDGWQLDMQTLTYVKVESPNKEMDNDSSVS